VGRRHPPRACSWPRCGRVASRWLFGCGGRLAHLRTCDPRAGSARQKRIASKRAEQDIPRARSETYPGAHAAIYAPRGARHTPRACSWPAGAGELPGAAYSAAAGGSLTYGPATPDLGARGRRGSASKRAQRDSPRGHAAIYAPRGARHSPRARWRHTCGSAASGVPGESVQEIGLPKAGEADGCGLVGAA